MRTDLFKRPVHFAAHAPLFPFLGLDAVSLGAQERLADVEALGWRSGVRIGTRRDGCGRGPVVGADVAIMLFGQEVGFEQRVVNQALEDGRQEARLRQVEQRSESWKAGQRDG